MKVKIKNNGKYDLNDSDASNEKEAIAEIRKNCIRDMKQIFVHVPKNYGTSTAHIIFKMTDSEDPDCDANVTTHMTANQMLSIKKYSDHGTFCITRNPYSRFCSVVNWRSRPGKDWLMKELTNLKTPIYSGNDHHYSNQNIRYIKIKSLIYTILTEYLFEDIVQKPTQYGWDRDSNKLDRMFLPQTTWHSESTKLYKSEDYHNEMIRLVRDLKIPEKNRSLESLLGTHHNNQRGSRRGEANRALHTILKSEPELHKKFLEYYHDDFLLFDYGDYVLK